MVGAKSSAPVANEISDNTSNISNANPGDTGRNCSGRHTSYSPVSARSASPHFFVDAWVEDALMCDASDDELMSGMTAMSDELLSMSSTIATSSRANTPFPLLQLLEKLIPPAPLFNLFDIGELLEIRRVCRSLRDSILEYILHDILKKSTILFSTKYLDDRSWRTEVQTLYPVIRQASKEERELSEDFLVYKPNVSAHAYVYRLREFVPTGLQIYLPMQKGSYTLQLKNTGMSRYETGEIRDDRTVFRVAPPDTEEDGFPVFTGVAGKGLMKAFYKRTDDRYTLHAFSIPFWYVLNVIRTEWLLRP